MPAAIAVECANEQGKFWQFHDKMFANQKALKPDNFKQYATELGLNMTKWQACVAGEKPKARIQADQKTAVSLGARGTPAFFINGRFLSGAQPFAKFKAIIDQELKKAKASGIAKAKYYKTAIETKGQKRM